MTDENRIKQPIIFLSYSRKDKREKDRLVTQIRVLERAGKVDLWSDDRIRAGSNWKSEIDRAMAKARVALLLITVNYLTSDFILDVEVPELIKRHEKAGLTIFPIIGRECPWQEISWLEKMNVRPKNGMPVWRSGGRYANQELTNIVREVAAIIKERIDEPVPESYPILSDIGESRYGAVKDAIESIKIDLYRVERSGQLPSLSDIEGIVRRAISYGAPLYNQGDIKGCAEVYCHTVNGLMSLMKESRCGPMLPSFQIDLEPKSWHGFKGDDYANVERDLAIELTYGEFKQLSGLPLSTATIREADEIAWDIRHCFDQIQFVARGFEAIDVTMKSFRESKEPISHLLNKLMSLTIGQSDRTYEEGLIRGKSWIRGCAVTYLYTGETILCFLPLAGPPSDKLSAKIIKIMEAKLNRVIPIRQMITNENAYKIAWDIRHVFNRALEAIRKP